MFLYRSNQSERLVDQLAEVVRRPQRDPFAAELIVVQSKGMERWLAMELSQRLRVCANAKFPFPRHLLSSLFDTVLGEAPEATAAWGEQALTWTLAALLPAHLRDPEFASIARYLEGDEQGRLRIGLAQRLAQVFDDYAVYRPELLLGWERGEEQGWEARLWRALVERIGRGHQAARVERFIAALGAGAAARAPLPERVSLFGISSLPPLYLSVLSALSEHVETHMFVLSPSREYFGDVRKRVPQGDADASDSEGHPLLASLGRLGRELQQVLEERAQYVESENDLYVDPGTDSLLHALQSDVLWLRNRGAPGNPTPLLPIAPNDESIAIHVCHGPMRELEVLHDQLVAVLENPSIEPHEIAVLTPDIETYAPVIEAVFGQKVGRPQLPFSVADRKTRTTHEAVDALYALLGALRGRMTSSAVLDLLSLDCVRRRFAIASEELGTLRSWVEQSGIRWGVDADHRAEVGQPGLQANTWRFGLDRMLLGYAMEGHGSTLYGQALPFDDIEGTSAELLGKLAEVCERLFRHRLALGASRPLPAWRDALLELLDDFLDEAPGTTRERQLVVAALASLCADAEAGGFTEPIDLLTVQTQLERALDRRLPARGLLSGGITFCQLVPMRSIPFKVVCLIGMNDEAFPGQSSHLGFDRMAARGQRRPGDHSRRDDDRYMFLEALLCARKRLIISYVGRGIHDNRVQPPSVVVGELLDAVTQGFTSEPVAGTAGPLRRLEAIEHRLCTVQRLHAFSPSYFAADPKSRLFSYATHYREAASQFGQLRPERRLVQQPLQTQSELRELTLDELVAWISLPIRTFLRRELGVYLDDRLEPLPEREPIVADGLDRWQFGNDLLQLMLGGTPAAQLLPAMVGRGVLPLGTVGELAYQRALPGVQALAELVAKHRRGDRLDPLMVDLELDGVHLTGRLDDLWPGAHLCVSYSNFGKRFELGHFVRHVVLGCVLAQRPRTEYPRRSVVIARTGDGGGAGEVEFAPLSDPRVALAELLELVRMARRFPLPFEHETARTYANSFYADASHNAQQALSAVRKSFESSYDSHMDAYVRAAYPDLDSLTAASEPLCFERLAERLFGPFFAVRSTR
jgi:exodeoxyribonuclease V gamma subunit